MLIEDKVSKIFITQHIFWGGDENTPLKNMLPHTSIITILPQNQHPFIYRNHRYGNEHY